MPDTKCHQDHWPFRGDKEREGKGIEDSKCKREKDGRMWCYVKAVIGMERTREGKGKEMEGKQRES